MSYPIAITATRHPMYPLRIEVYIRHRIQELGLTDEAFILNMEMRNFKRKQKKLHHLFNANWEHAAQLIPFLAAALKISDAMLHYLIDQTKADIAQYDETQRRKNFKPRAYFETRLARPTSITMAAITGATPYVDIADIDEKEYLSHVMSIFEKHPIKIRLLDSFFGGVLGIFIAYTSDLTVHFDLQGQFIGTSANGVLPGHCVVSIK